MPSVQFSSAAQLCPSLCDPKNRSTPGLPVHHQLPKFTQTHVHRVSAQTHVRWVSDAIQPSHPLSSPSPPALNLSQHPGLFQWVSSSHQVAKVLEFQLQHQLFYLLYDYLNVCCYTFQGLGQQMTRLWVAGVSLWLACLCGVTARDSHCCISISSSFFAVFSEIVP